MDRSDDDEFFDEWERRRRFIAQLVVCLVCYYHISKNKSPLERSILSSDDYQKNKRRRKELMDDFRTCKTTRDILRMSQEAFENLCNILRTEGNITDTRRATLEEQVAKFLYILAHNKKNRAISFHFKRSSETTSRHFHHVLRAIVSLENLFLKQPDGLEVPPQILNSSRFFPYFKDCMGALDGTHVHVKVSNTDAPRYPGRKDYPTQNVLAACSFDLKVTYVLPGWEAASEAPNTEEPSKATNTSSKKRKATSGLDEEKLNGTLDRIAVAMEMGNRIAQARIEQTMTSDAHITDVNKELRSLGLDDETYIKAYGFLVENPVKVEGLFWLSS